MFDSYDPRSRMAQMQANRGQPFRDTPDGVPGGMPQNQAALAAVQPSYTTQPYPSQSAPSAPGGGGPSTSPVAHPYGSAGTLIANAYQQHLGRTPSVQEIGSHLDYGRSTGANNILTALNNIRTSQEAQQRMQPPQAQPGSPVTSSGGVPDVGGYRPPTGGITGGMDTSATPATPDYTKLGQYAGQMGAWSTNAAAPSEKFARPWDQQSERYQMLSVLSNFDPRLGITPEVLAALNAANIHGAKFSGTGDKLTVDNAGGYDRFGTGGTADVITGFKTGNGTWAPWFRDETGGMGGGAPQGGGSMGFPFSVPQAANPLTGGAGSAYADMVLKYLAQQLGLSGALAGR